MQMSRLIKEGGAGVWGPGVGGRVGWGGLALASRGELNKDVSRPDRGGVREGVSEERHAWKVIKAA